MRKLLLFCGCLVLSAHLSAQVNVTGNSTPAKLSDVIASYQKMHPDYGKKENNILTSILPGLPKEENEAHYQFDRWLWYWRQHLDVNGYLVSSAKTWQEWQKVQAQQKNTGHERTTSGSTAASWSFVGPDSSGANGRGVGRINVVAFHPTDANTFWIGAPGGGAWKTTDNGANWVSMTDQLPLLSVSDIVFNPLNPNTVYLCTGDRDGNDYYGIGVLKSYDGGVTWNNTGMTWTADQYNIANSMVINPQDTNTLILATTAGLYSSHDGGATFDSARIGNFYQVLYCPSDTNILYATSFDYFGPGNAQIWKSANAGITWTQQTHYTTTNRITIGVTPAAPNIVFGVGSVAAGSNANGLDGIYKSSDTGTTYTKIYTGGCTGNLLTWDAGGSGCGGQGWYTLPLAVSLTDSNTVFTGGVNTWSSSDGGHTWNIANEWTYYGGDVKIIHADKHWMAFNPLTPATFFETNDGGIYSSSNPTATGAWSNLTNRMGIEEIYRTGVSNVASFAITGAQDDGTKVETIAGIYKEAVGGDGMACLLDFADSTVAYGSSEYGSIVSLNPTVGNPTFTDNDISSNISFGTAEGTGNWVTPFVLEPSCHTCILAGYDTIYKSTDMGNTWAPISGFLPANDNFTIYRVATTTADPNTIYATDDNTTQSIFCTHNGGTTWTMLTAPYTGSSLSISDIKVDPVDKNHFWITYAGYGTPQVAERDSAGTWTQMNAGLPDVPVLCLAVDYLSGDLYVGTEIGVYYRDTTMTSWAPFTTGMPSDEVTDVEINYATNELWASTYGRSLWKSPKHTATVLPTSVMNIVPFTADGITISPNPNHGNFTVTVKNIPDQHVKMHLTDVNGKTIMQGSGMLSGGKMDVNIQGLVTGTYIFEIDADNAVQGRQKLIVY